MVILIFLLSPGSCFNGVLTSISEGSLVGALKPSYRYSNRSGVSRFVSYDGLYRYDGTPNLLIRLVIA
jgi:hypothetical protein